MKTATLLAALKTAKPALLSQDFVPVLTHFCFEERTVYAYNDVAAIIVPVPVPLEVAIRGDTLLGVLEAMGEDVEMVESDGAIEITSGKSVVRLQYLKRGEFMFKPPSEEPNVKLPFDETMAYALQLCLLTVSNDAMRPELSGITVEMSKGAVTFYSSDNRAVTRYQASSMKGARKDKTVVIPKSTAEQLLSLYSANKDCENEIAFGDTILAASFDHDDVNGPILVSKLLQVKVARFTDIIEQLSSPSKGFFPVPATLKDAMTKADIVLGKLTERRCLFETTGGTLIIETNGGQFGDVHEEIDCVSDRGRVTIDPAMVLRTISHVTEIALAPRSLVLRCQNEQHTYLSVLATYANV